MHRLPLLAERQYIATIHTRLQESQPWKLPGLQATVRLAWALALRGISQLSDVTGKLPQSALTALQCSGLANQSMLPS